MRTLKTNLTLAALLAAVSLSAQAADTFNLRALNGEANWTNGDPDNATLRYRDWFNDGNAQTGATYTGGLVAPSPLYSVQGFTTGAETSPIGLTIDGQPVGQFRFSQLNGAAPRTLVVNGSTVFDQVHRLRMNGPTNADGARDTLFRRDRDNFAGSSAWDFVLPDAGMRYGMRFTDFDIGATYNDLVSMDVINSGGAAVAQMRRLAGDASGTISTFGVQNLSFASGLFGGYGMEDIDLVAMHLYWHKDTGRVTGELEMLSVGDGGNAIGRVGLLTFANGYSIFRPADDDTPAEGFTRLQVGASWNLAAPPPPVPEPSTYALMAGGLLAVGWAARRRRRA